MFQYVFIDPETIAEAAETETDLGRLIDVLRSLNQGCLMVETDFYRLGSELKAKAKAIGFQTERRMVGELLIHLWKKMPQFVIDGDDGELPLAEFAQSHAQRDSIDLILSPAAASVSPSETSEACTLETIHRSRFSKERHNRGAGLSFRTGEVSVEALFQKCFHKLINRAEKIVIVDYALGEYYNNTQPENLRRWVLWIDHALHDAKATTLIVRTVENSKNVRALKQQIQDLRNEVDLQLKEEFVSSKDDLPHRRFLIADGNCLDIDRGIDLCDSTGQCKQVDISYARQSRCLQSGSGT